MGPGKMAVNADLCAMGNLYFVRANGGKIWTVFSEGARVIDRVI
jgi:hypothetical protein